jgi:hypothetical protein
LVAVGIGYFGFAVYFALAPEFGPAWSAAAAGLLLIVVAALVALICRLATRRSRKSEPSATLGGSLGGPLGAAALGASLGPGPDIRGALGRNAITVLLAAFIAGMVMNSRR